MNRIASFGMMFVVAVSLGACKKPAPPAPKVATELGPESYAVAGVGGIESGPSISGTLVPRDQAVVRAQISGSVLRTLVQQGQNVRAGEVIAQLDNAAMADAVTSAKNGVMNGESALAVAKKELERQESLVKSGAISQQSVDMARRAEVAAEAGLSQAKAQLSLVEKQLGYSSVVAPFSGVVSEKSVSAGDVVQPGTALFTIVNPSTLELQGTIPANALNAVHIGLSIRFNVTGYPAQQFTGTVTRINPTADPMTRQVRIYAEIPNTGHALVGGLYAEGRIASITKTTLMLPTDAIDRKMISPAVLKLDRGIVQRAPVTLGTLDEKNNLIEVTSGIAAGDTVLRGSARDIALGSNVKFVAPKL